MDKCLRCGERLLPAGTIKLCGECRAAITLEVAFGIEAINAYYKRIQASENLEERLSLFDQIIEAARALLSYEEIGVEVAPPFPSEIIAEVSEAKDDFILEEIQKLLQARPQDSQHKAGPNPEPAGLTNLLPQLRRLKTLMHDPSRLEYLEAEPGSLLSSLLKED